MSKYSIMTVSKAERHEYKYGIWEGSGDHCYLVGLFADKGVAEKVKALLEGGARPKFKVKHYAETCGGCPTQYEGETEDGAYLYIRYRYGHFRVDINNETVYSTSIGDGMDGIMSFDEVQEASKSVLDWSGATYKEWKRDW